MSTIAASIAPKQLELETSNLAGGFVWKCREGAQIIFPESGRGLDLCLEVASDHVIGPIGLRPDNIGLYSMVGYLSDSLASCSVCHRVATPVNV